MLSRFINIQHITKPICRKSFSLTSHRAFHLRQGGINKIRPPMLSRHTHFYLVTVSHSVTLTYTRASNKLWSFSFSLTIQTCFHLSHRTDIVHFDLFQFDQWFVSFIDSFVSVLMYLFSFILKNQTQRGSRYGHRHNQRSQSLNRGQALSRAEVGGLWWQQAGELNQISRHWKSRFNFLFRYRRPGELC